jgi:hypothetical protein
MSHMGKSVPKRKLKLDHVRTVHAEEKGVCDICCKTFENRTYFQRRIRTVHSNSDTMYTCHHCLKQYKSNALLRNHIRIVSLECREVYPRVPEHFSSLVSTISREEGDLVNYNHSTTG